MPPESAPHVLPQLESYLAGDGPAELEHTAARAFGDQQVDHIFGIR